MFFPDRHRILPLYDVLRTDRSGIVLDIFHLQWNYRSNAFQKGGIPVAAADIPYIYCMDKGGYRYLSDICAVVLSDG